MKLVDVRHIAGTPDVVWAALFDTGLLQRCIPGCERFSGDPEAGFDVVVVQGVGPVSARFAGRVVVSQVVDGVSLRIDSEGQGGVAGFAKGGAHVSLAAEGDGTLLTYQVDAAVGGKIGQVGGRILDAFARNVAGQFFDRFKAEVEGTGPVPRKSWLQRWMG